MFVLLPVQRQIKVYHAQVQTPCDECDHCIYLIVAKKIIKLKQTKYERQKNRVTDRILFKIVKLHGFFIAFAEIKKTNVVFNKFEFIDLNFIISLSS